MDNGHIVVLGGGVMGCATAYYLTLLAKEQHKDISVTVVEATSIAGGASGKAGGFLARDWCDGQTVGQLARASYDLHAGLAETFSGTDYRTLSTLSLNSDARKKPKARSGMLPPWVTGHATGVSAIGNTDTTAQVHPYKLTTTFLEAAQKLGCSVHFGRAVDILTETGPSSRQVTGVEMEDGTRIVANGVVIAMGPWSHEAFKWIFGDKSGSPLALCHANSMVLRPLEMPPPCALFVELTEVDGIHMSPEFYPRPDGTIYMTGNYKDLAAPPATTADVECDDEYNMCVHPVSLRLTAPPRSRARMIRAATAMSEELERAEILKSQACILPYSSDDRPSIGGVGGVDGLFVATGHGCWGILNGPATGKALSELILSGKSSIDLSPFNPSRFVGS